VQYFDLSEADRNLKNILNPEDPGSDCVVFCLGSSTIKYGLASQLSPFIMPNIVARVSESPVSSLPVSDKLFNDRSSWI